MCLPISLWHGLPAYCKRGFHSPLLNLLTHLYTLQQSSAPDYESQIMVTSILHTVLPRSQVLETSVHLPARKVFEWRVRNCGNAEAVVPGAEDNICLVVLVSYFGISLHLSLPPDVEPPSIQCPKNITVKNEKNTFYASVSWRQPTSADNSGFHPIVTSVPVVNSPQKFKIGTTEIRVRHN